MKQKMITDAIRALFIENPPGELGPSDEPDSVHRLGYNSAIEDALDAVEKLSSALAAEGGEPIYQVIDEDGLKWEAVDWLTYESTAENARQKVYLATPQSQVESGAAKALQTAVNALHYSHDLDEGTRKVRELLADARRAPQSQGEKAVASARERAYVIAMLVAAGHVSQSKVDEAFALARKHLARNDAPRPAAQDDARDAERYRWVKENAEVIFKQSRGFVSSLSGRLIFSSMPAVSELDSAIDEIIFEEKQEAAAIAGEKK